VRGADRLAEAAVERLEDRSGAVANRADRVDGEQQHEDDDRGTGPDECVEEPIGRVPARLPVDADEERRGDFCLHDDERARPRRPDVKPIATRGGARPQDILAPSPP
jgi:hypothetical protein